MKGLERIEILTSADDRGWVTNLLDHLPIRPVDLANIHIVSMEPGTVRGNHYHNRQVEAICPLGSRIRIIAKNSQTAEVIDEIVMGSPPVLFVFQPGIAHAFRNEGDGPGYLICFADTKYDFNNPDVIPTTLLEKEN